MGIIAIIAALLLEQWRPLGDRKAVHSALAGWADWLERSFNAGQSRHGMIAWLVAVIVPLTVAAVLYLSLLWVSPVAVLGLVAAPKSVRFAFTTLAALVTGVYLYYVIGVGGDFMGLHRFIMPLFVLAAIVVVLGADHLVQPPLHSLDRVVRPPGPRELLGRESLDEPGMHRPVPARAEHPLHDLGGHSSRSRRTRE